MVGIEYQLDEFTDYWTEDDMIEIFKTRKTDYKSGNEYSNVSYQDVQQVTVREYTVSYISLSFDYSDSIHSNQYLAWIVLPDNFVVTCDISEYADLETKSGIDESSIFQTVFEAVTIE